jgi:hypothetical protein
MISFGDYLLGVVIGLCFRYVFSNNWMAAGAAILFGIGEFVYSSLNL